MNETRLNVKGMSCSSCVRHIQRTVGAVEGVRRVDVRLGEGRVVVTHDPGVDPLELATAITAAGYVAAAA